MRFRVVPALVGCVMAMVALGNFCAEAQARDHAAIAVVWKQGWDYHGVAVAKSAWAARTNALKNCGSPRCSLAQSYKPGQCYFLVRGKRQVFWNDRIFSAGEGSAVLDACRREDSACRIIASGCLSE